MKNFESFLFFRITGPKFANKSTDITDIIRKGDAAEGLNENKKHCLDLIIGRNIAKPHSQHNRSTPIITPNIPNEPMRISYVDFGVPRLLRVDSCHQIQTNG